MIRAAAVLLFLIGQCKLAYADHIFALPGPAGSPGGLMSVFPAPPLGTPFSIPGGDLLTVLTAPGSSAADTKYYAVAKSGSFHVFNAQFQQVGQPISVGQPIRSAVVTLDGTRLLLLAGNLRMYNTATGTEIQFFQFPDIGFQPREIVVSHDSRRAFVSSLGMVKALDLSDSATRVAGSSISLPDTSLDTTSLAMGPNGLLYVSAENRVFEVDPSLPEFGSSAVRHVYNLAPGTFGSNRPRIGRFNFTEDGTRAFAANANPASGAALYLFSLIDGDRSFSVVPSSALPGQTVSQIAMANRTLAYLITDRAFPLYSALLPPASFGPIAAPQVQAATFGSAGAISSPAALAVSPEFAGRRLYVHKSSTPASLLEIDLAGNNGPTLTSTAAMAYSSDAIVHSSIPVYFGPVSPAGFLRYGHIQPPISPGRRTLPFGVRVIDGFGRPVFRAPVVFSPITSEATLNGPATVLTNSDGYAFITANAPAAPGNFVVSALSAGLSASFQFTAAHRPLHGLNFSPYLNGQSPDARTPISEQQLRDRMNIVRTHTNWIRTFGAEDGLERACAVAREPGINLQIAAGAWISNDLAANERQLANLIAMARSCPVGLAIVGSEVLLRGNLTETQLIAYIARFRQAVPNVPVTTADTYAKLLAHPNVVSAVDTVMVNYYPYWEGYRAESAICVLDAWHQRMVQAAGTKQVIVSETGWPSAGFPISNDIDAARYFLEFVTWARAKNVPFFYFSAFDEAWKAVQEGPLGASWGIFSAAGTLKPGYEWPFAGSTAPVACAVPGGPGKPELTFTYVPVHGATTDTVLRGRALRVAPNGHRVAVYIQVAGLWWTKPTQAQKLTAIDPIGEWSANIVTGGNDHQASRIAAFLIPSVYDPPLLLGATSLPDELYKNASATADLTRTTSSISGRIVDSNGGGVSGIMVLASGQTALTAFTDSSGFYSFPNVANGSYQVTPSSFRFGFRPANRFLNVTASAPADFTATADPDAPANPSPANGTTGIQPNTLSWSSAARAAAYDVYLGASQPPPLLSAGLTETSVGPGTLAPNTTYHWKVVARSQSGTTESPLWSFTTGTSGPAPPTIAAPSPGQVISVSGVTFQWTSVPSAGYRLAILSQPSGNTVFSGILSGSSATSTLVSLPNGSYTFLARSCSGGLADANCGVASSVAFSVLLAAPQSAPAIQFPTNNATLSTSTHILRWSDVQGTHRYELQIVDAAGGNRQDLLMRTPDTSTVYSLPGSSRFEMRVRACTAGCGPWSGTVAFAVNLPPIPAVAPPLGTTTVQGGNQLQANWSSVANADLYVIQVVQPPPAGPGGGALTVASVRTASTSVTLPIPAGDADVIVAACNGNGCGPYSPPRGIAIAGPNPAAPVIGSPISGTVVDGPVVLLSWNRIPGDNGSTTRYRLFALDFSRDATALDIETNQNFWGGHFLAQGTRYDALAFANLTAAGPPVGFQVRGSSPAAPTMARPRHQSAERQGNITLAWTPVPGATLYEYFVAVQGQPNATVNGVTTGLDVQVPLFAANGAATAYSGIVRACTEPVPCLAGSNAGWGPWSNAAGPGVTNFTVAP